MIKATLLDLRFLVSLGGGLLTALVVFFGCYAILLIVNEKRITDIKHHSANLAAQISGLSRIDDFLLESPNAPKKSEVEKNLRILLGDDPFIEEISLIDQFQKIPIRVTQPKEAQGEETPSRASISLHGVLSEGQPIADERNLEYFVPLKSSSGMIRVHWKREAVVKYFHTLKIGIFYLAIGTFVLAFLFFYFILLRAYSREYKRFVKNLSMIGGTDYSQRMDIQQYSKDIAQIGIHVNRILHDTEEEKKKTLILGDTLNQSEKSNSNFRSALSDKTDEFERQRVEMRKGLVKLFGMMWNGIAIIDEEYHLHYSNERADHLLRFARFDESTIVDERLRRCLAPLVRLGTVKEIDSICAWSQPTMGCTASCHIRAAAIPSGDRERLFFLLLKEQEGYPEKHGATYFSERLVLDVLMPSQESGDGLFDTNSIKHYSTVEQENRFCECLHRIELLHRMEKGQLDEAVSIRLSSWLRRHYADDDLFSKYLQIDENTPDVDITLNVPELVLTELIDNAVFILMWLAFGDIKKLSGYVSLRVCVDAKGKPVITMTLPQCTRKLATHIQHVYDERSPLRIDDGLDNPLNLEDLDLDIRYSMFRNVKQLLRSNIECIFSESKKIATYRITIENHAFSPVHTNSVESRSGKTSAELLQVFLERA